MEFDREYKLPTLTEEEIEELNDLHRVVGMHYMYGELLKMSESKYGKVNAFTIELRKLGIELIKEENKKLTETYENSTLQSKLIKRMDYSLDPINKLKKAELDGALDANDSGLFK